MPPPSDGEECYHLLTAEERADSGIRQKPAPASSFNISCAMLLFLTTVVVVSNTVWMAVYNAGTSYIRTQALPKVIGPHRVRDSGEEMVFYKPYTTDFETDDLGVADPNWASLFPIGNGVVALTDATVAEMGLPASIRNPAEGNRSLYIHAGYHSLHCLTLIRRLLFDYRTSEVQRTTYDLSDDEWIHAKHCVGDLRQYILCNLDGTLLAQPTREGHPGEGQLIQCRKRDAADAWLEEHRHHPYQSKQPNAAKATDQ